MLLCKLHCKTPAFLPANRKRKQRLLVDGGEAAGLCVFLCILLPNQPQSFPQLEHGGEFMLAGVAAEAVTDQLGNALQACGAATESLIVNISRQGLIYIPAMFLLGGCSTKRD